MGAAGRIKPDNRTALINHLQAAAHMNRGGYLDLPLFQDCQFRRPAADIHIQNTLVTVLRGLGRTGTERRQHAFHMVPGRGADKITTLLRHRRRNCLRILPAQCLAGQNYGACVDIVGAETGCLIGIIKNAAEPLVRNPGFALVRRQGDRRLEQRLAIDHEVAAGHILRHPAQMQPRKNHLGPRRAYIDTDAGQTNVVGDPKGVLIKRKVVIIVVMIMVRIRAVLVKEYVPQGVIFQGMIRQGSRWRFGRRWVFSF